MKYYKEIVLLPCADIGSYFIWQKVYQQVHLALVENKNQKNSCTIGATFPEYNADKFILGNKLRLFAKDNQVLKQMRCEKWLERLRDYVSVGPIRLVPEALNGYACFKHVKMKGNKEKLAKRRAKRKGETFERALAHFADYEELRSKLPYINMISQTNGHRFRIFIEMLPMEQPEVGFFSCYGLSSTTTVPLF